jgi:hypothetical protein
VSLSTMLLGASVEAGISQAKVEGKVEGKIEGKVKAGKADDTEPTHIA